MEYSCSAFQGFKSQLISEYSVAVFLKRKCLGLEVIKMSCLTPLSMKFIVLINVIVFESKKSFFLEYSASMKSYQ